MSTFTLLPILRISDHNCIDCSINHITILAKQHHGSRQRMVLSSQEIRARLKKVQSMCQPSWSDQKVLTGHVQTVFPTILKGYRFPEAEIEKKEDVLNLTG